MANGYFNIGKGIYNFWDILSGNNESMSAEDKTVANNLVKSLPAPETAPSNAFSLDTSALGSAIEKGFKGFQDILMQISTNALDAEKQAAAASNAFTMEMQKDQQRYNSEQAELAWSRSQSSAQAQMDFQERMANQAMAYQTNMANTAYQRAVKDMQSAGINPILAYTQGGASSPAGISASGASSSATAASSSAGSGAKANASSGYSANINAVKYKVIGQVVTTAFDLLSNFFK